MENIFKIGMVGIVSSILLTACFESSPKSVAEDFIDAAKDGDFKEMSKSLSSDAKDKMASAIMYSCLWNRDIKNKVIPLLKENDIDSKTFTNYISLSNEIQNKILNVCFKEMIKMRLEKKGEPKIKILTSEIDSSGKKATVIIEEINKKGKSNKKTLQLEKINDEWKITEGLGI